MRCCRSTGVSQDSRASNSPRDCIRLECIPRIKLEACRFISCAQHKPLQQRSGLTQISRIASQLTRRSRERSRITREATGSQEVKLGPRSDKVQVPCISLYLQSCLTALIHVSCSIPFALTNSNLQRKFDWQQHVLFCGVGLGLASVHRVTLAILAVPFQVL